MGRHIIYYNFFLQWSSKFPWPGIYYSSWRNVEWVTDRILERKDWLHFRLLLRSRVISHNLCGFTFYALILQIYNWRECEIDNSQSLIVWGLSPSVAYPDFLEEFSDIFLHAFWQWIVAYSHQRNDPSTAKVCWWIQLFCCREIEFDPVR